MAQVLCRRAGQCAAADEYGHNLPAQDQGLKLNGLHTGKDNWNKQWKEFKDQNPTATREEILKQLEKMKKEHGL